MAPPVNCNCGVVEVGYRCGFGEAACGGVSSGEMIDGGISSDAEISLGEEIFGRGNGRYEGKRGR